MNFNKLLFLSAFTFFPTLAICIDSVRLETRGNSSYIIHQVDPGETLYSISRRYKADVKQVVQLNKIVNNSISVGQFLEIPYTTKNVEGKKHVVKKGETLYSISKLYNASVDDIILWNNLTSNSLSLGQSLVISLDSKPGTTTVALVENNSAEKAKPVFTYVVQTGESIEIIANKFSVAPDSIRNWNNLTGNKLSIGQKLNFPFLPKEGDSKKYSEIQAFITTEYGTKKRSKEEGGVKKSYEEGIARLIESGLETNKYLILHRKLKTGTVVQVRNLMNNETIYARVVGQLPSTGENEKTMIRMTSVCFKRLGILDEQAMVELIYFEN